MKMFDFARRNRLPRLDDLSAEQRAALPRNATVTHLDFEERTVFGRVVFVLRAWIVGASRPLLWRRNDWQ